MRLLLTADPELPVPPLGYGGIERIIDSLVRQFRHDHEIALVSHPQSCSPAHRHYPWPAPQSRGRRNSLHNSWALYRAVQDFQPDLIHSFSRLQYLLPLLRGRIPLVMSFQRLPTAHTVRMAKRLAGDRLQFTGCSQWLADYGQSLAGRWQGIPNFVDPTAFTFRGQAAPDAPLVFLSRIERIKGAHTAIAAALACGQPLILAGNRVHSPEAEQYWQDEIEPWLSHPLIRYVGEVDDAAKNHWLGQARAMLLPIEWDEPFGIVMAEALACGTPVIAFRRGAAPEIIRDGIDGWLVDSQDDMVAAIGQLSSLNRAACRQRVEQEFTTQVVAARYLTLYQNHRQRCREKTA